MKRLLLLLLAASPLFAEQIAVSEFGYLNSNENSVIIQDKEASDILNVDVTPGGRSIKKRTGYGVHKTLTPSSGIHGLYHFFDSIGNDVMLAGSSTSLTGIVADGSPITIVSSATVNSTWDCTDTQGSAYCVNSNRNAFIRTDGTTLTNWYTSPLGTMVEATPDRVVVSGVGGNLNTLYISQANTFTNFIPGPLATDAFTEVIAAPGSKLTHIRWGCGKLLWWKDQSLGYFAFDDQFSAQVKIISDSIGTFDNASAVDPGGSVWFRGQDGHVWRYDCSALTKETIEITPQINASGRRTSNVWIQTSQSDFESGAIVPTGALSTSIAVNSVVPSSITLTDTSSVDFALGSSIGVGIDTTTVSGAVTLKTYISEIFTTLTNWTSTTGSWSVASGYLDSTATDSGLKYTVGDNLADFIVQFDYRSNGGTTCGGNLNSYFGVVNDSGLGYGININDNGVGTSFRFLIQEYSAWAEISGPTVESQSSNIDVTCDTSWHTIKLIRNNVTGVVEFFLDGVSKGTLTDTTVNAFTRVRIHNLEATAQPHPNFDSIYLISRAANFNSRAFDTGFFSPIYGPFTINTSTSGTYSHSVRTSAASGSGYGADSVIASGQVVANIPRRYLVYSSTLTTTDVAVIPQVTDATLIAASSGTFYSAVKNAPTIGAWSTFNPAYANNNGSHAFYVRSSSNSFTVLSATPAWTAQAVNAQVVVTTYTYFQVKDDFSISFASQTPTLSDFSLNWFEGNAADQAYLHYFDNAIWASVAYGAGVSSNTYVFRRDLINEGWGLYNFGAGGMLTQNNHLFFGSVGDGKIFQFGSGTSDNGTAIESYWKSKDFTGPDPFLSNQLQQIDIFARQNTGQSFTATYATDTSTTTTSYVVNLSTASQSIIQSRKLLPSGKNGYVFNIKFGDTSTTSAWEVLGFRMGFTPLPYRPSL